MLKYIAILFILCSHSISSDENSLNCTRYVPVDYDRYRSPEEMVKVDFDYRVEHFDSIDADTHVSVMTMTMTTI